MYETGMFLTCFPAAIIHDNTVITRCVQKGTITCKIYNFLNLTFVNRHPPGLTGGTSQIIPD